MTGKVDLLLKGGRVMDPSVGLDAHKDVAFTDGKISAILDSNSPVEAKEVQDVSGCIVCPGLIDLHTHVYWGATGLGVNAEDIAGRSATTTFIDAGSAGAGNFGGLKHFIADNTDLRILGFINISFAGICGFSKKKANLFPECEDIRLLDTDECLEAIEKYRESIVGIKVRIGRYASGSAGMTPLQIAREVGEETGLPLMTHVDFPPPDRDDVLNYLRPGDVLTHCFRPFPNAPLYGNGSIREAVTQARERGIIFDLGHGGGSLSFQVSRKMLEQDFLPDTISSDVHLMSVDGPAFDILVTMSKFLCLGMPLMDVIRASTTRPAEAIQRPDLGNLQEGSPGDAAVLRIEEGRFEYYDVKKELLLGDKRMIAEKMVVKGKIWR